MGLHVRVCGRQSGALRFPRVAKFPRHEIFPVKQSPYKPPHPLSGIYEPRARTRTQGICCQPSPSNPAHAAPLLKSKQPPHAPQQINQTSTLLYVPQLHVAALVPTCVDISVERCAALGMPYEGGGGAICIRSKERLLPLPRLPCRTQFRELPPQSTPPPWRCWWQRCRPSADRRGGAHLRPPPPPWGGIRGGGVSMGPQQS